MEFLAGYKTYLLVAAAVIVGGGEYAGFLPVGTFEKVDGVLAILGLGTLRDAIKKK